MHATHSRRFHRTDKRTWSLLDDNGTVLGSLVKPKWFSSKRELVVGGGLYEVKSLKRWSSDQAVFFGGFPVLTADMAFDRIRIAYPGKGDQAYIVRRKNLFSKEYHVLDLHGVVQASLRTRMNWSDFEREPELLTAQGEAMDPMLLLFVVHVIAVQYQNTMGVAAGA
ncbi:MAG: hypothetical protein JNM62_07725 [Flavobacteriales bacterium]|nr:hypothetical protein [Flavobacteriales bacterium]